MMTSRYLTPDGRAFKVEGGEDIVLAHLGTLVGNEEPLAMPAMNFGTPAAPTTHAEGGEEPLVMPAMSFSRN